MRFFSNLIQLVPTMSLLVIFGCSDPVQVVDAETSDEPIPANAEEETTKPPADPFADPFIDLTNDFLIPPPQPQLQITTRPGHLVFSWEAPEAGSAVSLLRYQIDKREFEKFYEGDSTDETTTELSVNPHLFDWAGTRFILEICSKEDCIRSAALTVEAHATNTLTRLSAEYQQINNELGRSLSISDGGTLLFAGAPARQVDTDSAITGQGGVQSWFRIGQTWWPETLITPDQPNANDRFGHSVDTDITGEILAVGAPLNDRSDPSAGSAASAGSATGAAFIFERLGEGFVQIAELAGDTIDARLGTTIRLSDDGNTLFVGAPGSIDQTQGSVQPENVFTGMVHVYSQSESGWFRSQTIQPPDDRAYLDFGRSLTINSDGSKIAIGAYDSQSSKNVLLILKRNNDTYSFIATLGNDHSSTHDFAHSTVISEDGKLIATSLTSVAGPNDTELSPGPGLEKPGASIVLYRENTMGSWEILTQLTPPGQHTHDSVLNVDMASDGSVIVAGLTDSTGRQGSVSTFVSNANSDNNDERPLFPSWQLQSVLDDPASPTNAKDRNGFTITDIDPRTGVSGFANSVALSRDGTTLAIGAPGDLRAEGNTSSGVYVSGSVSGRPVPEGRSQTLE